MPTVLVECMAQNALEDPEEIARFYDRCSDLMRELLDGLAEAPDRPRPFPDIEDAIGGPGGGDGPGPRPPAAVPRHRGRDRVAAAADRLGPRRRLAPAPHRVRRVPALPLPGH